jgi:uncharacterized protein YaeQ
MLFHFQFEVSDIDRGLYESLDFRLAQHPSETIPYLLCRAFAYALSYEEGLEFSGAGLSDPEAPALRSTGIHGVTDLWIEIGNPSAKKLHKASKAANRVRVYTYKSAEILLQEIRANAVHRAEALEIFAIDSKFLQQLESHVEKNNRWSLLFQQGQLDVSGADFALSTEIKSFSLRA